MVLVRVVGHELLSIRGVERTHPRQAAVPVFGLQGAHRLDQSVTVSPERLVDERHEDEVGCRPLGAHSDIPRNQ